LKNWVSSPEEEFKSPGVLKAVASHQIHKSAESKPFKPEVDVDQKRKSTASWEEQKTSPKADISNLEDSMDL